MLNSCSLITIVLQRDISVLVGDSDDNECWVRGPGPENRPWSPHRGSLCYNRFVWNIARPRDCCIFARSYPTSISSALEGRPRENHTTGDLPTRTPKLSTWNGNYLNSFVTSSRKSNAPRALAIVSLSSFPISQDKIKHINILHVYSIQCHLNDTQGRVT